MRSKTQFSIMFDRILSKLAILHQISWFSAEYNLQMLLNAFPIISCHWESNFGQKRNFQNFWHFCVKNVRLKRQPVRGNRRYFHPIMTRLRRRGSIYVNFGFCRLELWAMRFDTLTTINKHKVNHTLFETCERQIFRSRRVLRTTLGHNEITH